MTATQRAKEIADKYWQSTVVASVHAKLKSDIAKAIRAAVAASKKRK
jgi:hypothetical protein